MPSPRSIIIIGQSKVVNFLKIEPFWRFRFLSTIMGLNLVSFKGALHPKCSILAVSFTSKVLPKRKKLN